MDPSVDQTVFFSLPSACCSRHKAIGVSCDRDNTVSKLSELGLWITFCETVSLPSGSAQAHIHHFHWTIDCYCILLTERLDCSDSTKLLMHNSNYTVTYLPWSGIYSLLRVSIMPGAGFQLVSHIQPQKTRHSSRTQNSPLWLPRIQYI